jgi:hypothetical protein
MEKGSRRTVNAGLRPRPPTEDGTGWRSRPRFRQTSLCEPRPRMVKRAGRPKFQLDKRNVNHKRRDSIITRIGCSGGAAKLG